MGSIPPPTPDLTAEKEGSSASNGGGGVKKRTKKPRNAKKIQADQPDAARVNQSTISSSFSNNCVGNGLSHTSSSSGSRSNSSKHSKHLHSIICLIIGVIIGYFGHELYPTPHLFHYHDSAKEGESKESKKGIFKSVIDKHKKKHKEIAVHNSIAYTSPASEEIDRLHPIRHILEGASVFCHVRKQNQAIKIPKKTAHQESNVIEVDWKKWKFARSDDFELTSDQIDLVKELEQRVVSKESSIRVCPNGLQECAENEKEIESMSGGTNLSGRSFIHRVDSVPWGGHHESDSTRWWPRKDVKDPNKMCDGGRLLAGYLKIMKYPKDLRNTWFPRALCQAQGCDAAVSILHTLEWREKYKPWCVTSKTMKYNENGFIYRRGNSRPGPRKELEAILAKDSETLSTSGHSLLFYRPAVTTVKNRDLYGRVILHAIDSAVADSLIRNKGEIGRFNIIFDCKDFGSKNAPSLADVKLLFRYLQDHFPDRLGVLIVANLGGMAQMLMKMVLPFVTEDVRAKIHVLPSDDESRRDLLLQFIDEDQIPNWLGGKDDYQFDVSEYYENEKCVLSEEEISNFLTEMPYHG